MTFQRDGFQIIEGGLTAAAVELLSGLSHQHEAAARAENKPWAGKGRFEVAALRTLEIFGEPAKKAILANTDCGWPRLMSSICYPQVTYAFQTDQGGLALLRHVDGSEDGPEEAAEYEILVGVLLSSVVSEAEGAFVLWPGSHLSGREFLRSHPGVPAWNALRMIPRDDPSSPRPFTGHTGDVILGHRLLQHGTAARSAPGVRRMAFFRLGFVWHEVNTPVEKTGLAR
jgi:hypothetical protein